MALVLLLLCAAILSCVSTAPQNQAPARGDPYYGHPTRNNLGNSPQLQYFLENPPEGQGYYNNIQQRQAAEGTGSSRLENLEPDNDVELLPGAQQPQPPQQTPVSPGVQGLLPGQRFYIIHPMSILPNAYRPGVPVPGYQPVYIVAAAPAQGEYAAPGLPGYQNAIVLDPTGQAGLGARGGHVSLAYPRPLDFGYHNPDPALAYQNGIGLPGAVRFAQLISLQRTPQLQRPVSANTAVENPTRSEQQRASESNGSSESIEENSSAQNTGRAATPNRTKPKP